MTRPDRSSPHEEEPLLDFAALAARLRRVLLVLAVLVVVGAGAEVAAAGWSAGVPLRWLTLLVAATLVTTAVLTALQALGGADRAQRRGERLSSEDVGWMPARRRADDEG